MEKTKNVFLGVNANRINSLFAKIEEERFKSSYQGQLDLGVTISMLKGMITEIQKLQKENDELKVKLGTPNASAV
jgi:hypothetical protein